MHAHPGQSMLQTATHFWRHQRRENTGFAIHQRHRFPRATKIHRQFAANQSAADNQHPLRVTQLRFTGLVLLLAVKGKHQFAARDGRNKRTGPGCQHQLVVLPLLICAFDDFSLCIQRRHTRVGKQAQVELLSEIPRRLAGEISGTLPKADDMAQIRLVVLIHTVAGNQRQRCAGVGLADVFYQLAGGKARPDNHNTCAHTASVASTSKTSLPSEHSGQRKLSGTSHQAVPGATSCMGSPFAGS